MPALSVIDLICNHLVKGFNFETHLNMLCENGDRSRCTRYTSNKTARARNRIRIYIYAYGHRMHSFANQGGHTHTRTRTHFCYNLTYAANIYNNARHLFVF